MKVLCDHAGEHGCDEECGARVGHVKVTECKRTFCSSVAAYVKCVPVEQQDWSSNLNKVKVGDWIATIQMGWGKVSSTNNDGNYPVDITTDGQCTSYACNGFYQSYHKAPSAFAVPPTWLLEIIGPKPCEFVKGDPVMVRDNDESEWLPRYFSHIKGSNIFCFCNGLTPWTTEAASPWSQCRKPTEEELK